MTQVSAGFYGKLPSHGDFLRRRVSDGFVDAWDAWLQDAIHASRSVLGPQWLTVYLTSPAWRFAGAAGACGRWPVVGVMAPSVDRVGRYFPLSVVAELPDDVDILSLVSHAEPFFDAAEHLVVETLESDPIDFERFDQRVGDLGSLLAPALGDRLVLDPEAAAAVLSGRAGGAHVRIAAGASPGLAPVFTQLLASRLSALYDPVMLWWSDGSAIVEPSCLLTRGLPDPEAFAALLDGAWDERAWLSVGAEQRLAPASDGEGLEREDLEIVPPRLRSAAATDVGRVRTINQDAYIERADVGIWAVADGLGGHRDGEVASRMVCDAVADLVPDRAFDDLIEAASARIRDVNDHLVALASRSLDGVACGSTVVLLLVRGVQIAVLWAGDSRVYRFRDGLLQQLTRDHSLAESETLVGGEDANVITRAVGGEPGLVLDVHRDDVRPGDRFLLCSDGLTRMLPLHRIADWMGRADVEVAAQGLIAATLDAGAPDNVTVVVVDAHV